MKISPGSEKSHRNRDIYGPHKEIELMFCLEVMQVLLTPSKEKIYSHPSGLAAAPISIAMEVIGMSRINNEHSLEGPLVCTIKNCKLRKRLYQFSTVHIMSSSNLTAETEPLLSQASSTTTYNNVATASSSSTEINFSRSQEEGGNRDFGDVKSEFQLLKSLFTDSVPGKFILIFRSAGM